MLSGNFILTAHVLITFRNRTLLQERGKPVYVLKPRLRQLARAHNINNLNLHTLILSIQKSHTLLSVASYTNLARLQNT